MRHWSLWIAVALFVLPPLLAGAAEKPRVYPMAQGRLVWDRVRFRPAPGYERDMLGGKFCGSNVSATAGYEVLAEIKEVPPAGQWSELQFDGRRPHRWIRYEAPPGSYGHVGKLEFYAGPRRLGGPGFGSIGGKQPGRDWPRVFDAKDVQNHFFMDGDTPNGHYVGMDLGDFATAVRPAFDPPPADAQAPLRVTLKSPTPGTTIRYTLDGTTPTADTGRPYTAPLAVDDVTTIVAVSFNEGFAPSPPSIATYVVGPAAKPGLSTFHIGNSLTGSTTRVPDYIRTAGYPHTYRRYLQPGIWTFALWENDVLKTKERWEQTLSGVQRVDHFTLQPRDPDVAHEARYDILFFDLIRDKFPEMQPWIYAEWTSRLRNRPWDQGLVPSTQMQQVFPALTWEESASAMLVYLEDLQQKVLQTYTGGKRPRIIPSVLAVGWVKNLLDHGQIPGLGPQDFDPTMFFDGVHPGPIGCYLIDMTWFAAFYRQSPEGRILPIYTELNTPQAAALQRLAWDTVQNYPDTGLYAAGTTPVAQPEFSLPPTKLDTITRVTLSSATPGAWFRYTLDGTPPTRTRGYVYCGVISVRPGMTVKALAYKSGMADSPVVAATYPEAQPIGKVPPLPENVVLERDIQYGQAGEHPLLLDIVRPKAESPQPRPVVLFIHGGGWAAGDKLSALGTLIPLAAGGNYFCATANYRLSGTAPWPAQLHDCKAAVRWLKANARKYHIDPAKIAVAGHSAGGHLVSMLGLTGNRAEFEGTSGSLGYDSSVACVVDLAGPSNMLAFATDPHAAGPPPGALAKLFAGSGARWQQIAREASPLTYAAGQAPPFLIVHGTADNLVPFSQAETLAAALKQAGNDATLVKLVNGGHGTGHPEVAQRISIFLEKYLRGQPIALSDAPIELPAATK